MNRPAEAHGCHEDEPPIVITGQGDYREEEHGDEREGFGALWWLLFCALAAVFFALAFVDHVARGLA